MKKKKYPALVIFVIAPVVLAGWLFYTHYYSFYGNMISPVTINGKVFRSEIVSSSEKLRLGLGGRKDLCSSCAMLFQFTKPGKYSFWMKDMRFPLDILWISNDEIVHIEKNVQSGFMGILAPAIDANSVLEINAGVSDDMSIKIGDKVNF